MASEYSDPSYGGRRNKLHHNKFVCTVCVCVINLINWPFFVELIDYNPFGGAKSILYLIIECRVWITWRGRAFPVYIDWSSGADTNAVIDSSIGGYWYYNMYLVKAYRWNLI